MADGYFILDAEGFRIFWIQKVFVSFGCRRFSYLLGYRRFSYLWNIILAGEAWLTKMDDGRRTKDAAPTHHHILIPSMIDGGLS